MTFHELQVFISLFWWFADRPS